jgi:2-iminoacetate synthase ThiH
MIQVEQGIVDILDKSLSGKRISKEEAYELMLSDSLFSLGFAANSIREKKCGDAVSYIVNRNINFTNICQGTCKFCAYRVGIDSNEGFLMSHKAILERTREAVMGNATEICLQGGLNPDIDINYYVGILETIKSRFDIHIHAFSPRK